MTGGRPDEEQAAGSAGPEPATEGPVTNGTAGDGGTGAAADAPVDELAKLRGERDEYLDMVRRVQADFENYKKRMVRQQTELLERAAEGLVTKLLPVLDAFELARAHLEDEGSAEGKALLQAAGLLQDTLVKEGLERVDEVDVAFDPTVHEAVEHQPLDESAAVEADGPQGPVVTGILRSGYRYKGKVVRPAMVRVLG